MLARYEQITAIAALALMLAASCHTVVGLDGLEKRFGEDDGGQAGSNVGVGGAGEGGIGTGPGPGPGAGGGAPSVCGDGIIDNNFEDCDDGNNQDGDGCSGGCLREAGWCCMSQPSMCMPGPIEIGGPGEAILIPDDGWPDGYVCMTHEVPALNCGPVIDIDVRVSLDHTFVGDLVIWAINPNEVTVTLLDEPENMMVKDSSNLTPDYPILFDDDADVSSEMMGFDVGNNENICQEGSQICDYWPEEPLALLTIDKPEGMWQLCVADDSDNNVGSLNGVEFVITTD